MHNSDSNRRGVFRFATDTLRNVVFLPFQILAFVGLLMEAGAAGLLACLAVFLGGWAITANTGTDHLMPTVNALSVLWGAAVFLVVLVRLVRQFLQSRGE